MFVTSTTARRVMARTVLGRLNGVHAEPGTLLGPNDVGEYMVVLADDERGVSVGWALTPDFDAAALVEAPRSVAEHRLFSGAARRRR
jgi:hypothetical protein